MTSSGSSVCPRSQSRSSHVRSRFEGGQHGSGRGEHVLLGRPLEPRAEDRVGEELRAPLAGQERQVGLREVTLPPPEDQGVDRDDDRSESALLRTRDEARRDFTVVDPVELEPARRVSHDFGDLLDGMRRRAREDQRNSGRGRRACGLELALGAQAIDSTPTGASRNGAGDDVPSTSTVRSRSRFPAACEEAGGGARMLLAGWRGRSTPSPRRRRCSRTARARVPRPRAPPTPRARSATPTRPRRRSTSAPGRPRSASN